MEFTGMTIILTIRSQDLYSKLKLLRCGIGGTFILGPCLFEKVFFLGTETGSIISARYSKLPYTKCCSTLVLETFSAILKLHTPTATSRSHSDLILVSELVKSKMYA
ncbi:hypothetical protein TNCT_494881 [Trichonephila clavata]|uniref:Uncharacterized protein n=1 Tax=Trichonephila clavata TaxID=2740835 RepID=A0A8X6FRD8_TRICU|nr:hypothetical protein TNCT_494881 [Trichonephila clavata]